MRTKIEPDFAFSKRTSSALSADIWHLKFHYSQHAGHPYVLCGSIYRWHSQHTAYYPRIDGNIRQKYSSPYQAS